MKTFNGDDMDIVRLIETRMLVSANAGGGKSWALRNLLERTHGKVQQIVLDMEGEFGTLREKYDYVLVGKGGDIPADVRSAAMLATKLLELEASAIVDLYELPQHERIRYVKFFLDAMVNAPKELWHPVLVVLDEAHVFAPEKRESEAMGAVADLASRGRKRGYCLVAATQRLSKLNKDVAAELNNVLIGRTGLDIDAKRAAESLGFTTKEQLLGLRKLTPGEFYAYGPAISEEVIQVKLGNVQTTHPKAGQRGLGTSPAPRKTVLAVLDKLKDLPQKAQEELRTIDDHKKEIANLRRELTNSKRPGLSNEDLERFQNAGREQGRNETLAQCTKEIATRDQTIQRLLGTLEKISELASTETEFELNKKMVNTPIPKYKHDPNVNWNIVKPIAERKILVPIPQTSSMVFRQNEKGKITLDDDKSLRAGVYKMLRVVAQFHPEPINITQLGTLAGYTPGGGTFDGYLSQLKQRDWVEVNGDVVSITENGRSIAGDVEALPHTVPQLIELWCSKFSRAGVAKMMRHLAEVYPRSISKEELGEATGYTPGGGTFDGYLSELKRNKLIEVDDEMVCASRWLMQQ